MSSLVHWYHGRVDRFWWGNHISFSDVVEDLVGQMRRVSADGKKICLLGIGVGALVGYAASRRYAPHALAMISPELPAGYVKHQIGVTADRWYKTCIAVNRSIGRCTPPLRVADLPQYRGVTYDRVRLYTKQLVSAPAQMVAEIHKGISLPPMKSNFTKMLVVACDQDGLFHPSETERFAEGLDSDLYFVDETRLPYFWSEAAQKEGAAQVQQFFIESIRDRPRMKLVYERAA